MTFKERIYFRYHKLFKNCLLIDVHLELGTEGPPQFSVFTTDQTQLLRTRLTLSSFTSEWPCVLSLWNSTEEIITLKRPFACACFFTPCSLEVSYMAVLLVTYIVV